VRAGSGEEGDGEDGEDGSCSRMGRTRGVRRSFVRRVLALIERDWAAALLIELEEKVEGEAQAAVEEVAVLEQRSSARVRG
jgi:hypothetical protein